MGSRLAFPILLSVLLAAACSEKQATLTGFDAAPGILDSTRIRQLTIPASNLDTFFQTTRNGGPVIWAGIEPEAVEAKAFLRFPLSALPAGAVLTGATLVLNADAGGDYGDRTTQELEVQRVTAASWYASGGQGWPFQSHEPTSPPASFAVATCDTPDVRFTVAVPIGLVSAWIAAPDSNHGLALVARGSGGWKRFRAERTVVSAGRSYTLEAPALEVRFTVDGEADTVRLSARERATLYSVSPAVGGGTGREPYALIGGPFDYRAIVRFSLDTLATYASLNRLELALRIDPAQVSIGQASARVTVGAHEVVELPGEDLDPLPVVGFAAAPVATVTVDAASDTSFTLDLTALGVRIERGVLLKVEQDFPSLVRLGVVTREGAAGGRPALRLTYGLPPRSRL